MARASPELTPEFQQWVLHSIPLLNTMQLNFKHFSENGLIMSCPLAPNINDKGTGFGGSIGTLATICGWIYTMIHAQTVLTKPEAMIVEQQMQFKAPVTGEFIARCNSHVPNDFYQKLETGKSGKLNLDITVSCQGVTAAEFQGFYIAKTSAYP